LKKHILRNVCLLATFPFVILLLAGSIIVTVLSGAAKAELIDNGAGLIYDTDLDITWYVPNVEEMTWSEAVSWVAQLRVSNENASNITGWRLPSVLNEDGSGPCNDYDCIGSEFGHLCFTELGNASGGPLVNKGPFDNLKSAVYWSALKWASYAGNAWAFSFSTGLQGFADKNLRANFYPVAVHDGNVGGSVRSMKLAILANVKEAMNRTGNSDDKADYQAAIAHLSNTLDDSLWLDDNHLDPLNGRIFFREEAEAGHHLDKLLVRGIPVLHLINALTDLDRYLAQNAVGPASPVGGTRVMFGEKTVNTYERLWGAATTTKGRSR